MEGAYQLKSENMVQDNEWIRDEHVRLIPSNQMVEEDNN